MSYFHNKRIWVTGASSGIGRSVAIKLSKLGAEVILTARNRGKLEEVKKECGNAKAHIFDHDLSNLESIDDLVSRVTREVGSIDILFNNAGVSAYSAANETDFSVYTQVMNLNFLSVVKLTKCLLPQMISNKKGQIVTNTSLSGKFGSKKRTVYASSKHALHGFMDSLRAEVHEHNIKVNTVAPGFVNTEIGMKALTGDGTPYGANDRGHESQGMDLDKASEMIIKSIEANKREAYIVPKISFPKIALYISRYFPGLGAVIARNYNEEDNG